MVSDPFLHELSDFDELIQVVSGEYEIAPQLVEKDYWIMQCLFGLTSQGFSFQLKGGTSLSKGYNIIDRFSEDIDIQIDPPEGMDVKCGKNHVKDPHIESRRKFFEWLVGEIKIPGIDGVEIDPVYSDRTKCRTIGIRLKYPSRLGSLKGIKDGVLLEVGFDDVEPNDPVDISSWLMTKHVRRGFDLLTTLHMALNVIDRGTLLLRSSRLYPLNFGNSKTKVISRKIFCGITTIYIAC